MSAPPGPDYGSPYGLASAGSGRSGTIPANNNPTEVGPLQASTVGPVQTAAPNHPADP